MNTDLKDIEKSALKLHARDRAELAKRLLVSLEDSINEDIDDAWMQELKRRKKELESGKVKTISAKEIAVEININGEKASLSFHPEAAKELQASAEFYEAKSEGLVEEFLNEAGRTLTLIGTNPNLGFPLSSYDRRMMVQRFPYGILYTVGNDHIEIHALMHLHREPGYWKARK